MARLIPAAERIIKARMLIQKARDFPVSPENGKVDLNYIASVKALLQDARDMVKFISYSPTTTIEVKHEVELIYQETEKANQEILHS
jgi:hypothetical protein